MEIRAKLKQIHPKPELSKQINFDIKQLSENSQKLYIEEEDDMGREIEQLAKEQHQRSPRNIRANNTLWKLIRKVIWGKQPNEFPQTRWIPAKQKENHRRN